MITQSSIAPLQNVSLCSAAISRALSRPNGLPGILAFYGPSGYGKSVAATYSSNKHRAYYVQCKSAWTKKAFLMALLREMGVQPVRTIPEMVDQAAQEIALSGRPLIIDEADFLVEKNIIEIVRDIYESTFCPILLIGEEQLPAKLKKFERFHNRVLQWIQAQPVNLQEAGSLAKIYAPGIEIHDNLMQSIMEASRHVTRRVCVNLNLVNEVAKKEGWHEVDASLWGKRELYTGQGTIRKGVSL
ncbi:DNA transposition protein [Thiomicrospira sp. XS5]|uniref:AAA family ATPase n=1 Tax=Thiomicrospira sp. XS5 TaxID=1775636 RepID=UPI00074B25DD|nr:ATP-binding protein [Thiomicrospira sp. XS5]KUJ73900.1 DNA transposition protein [Thiomicrospira sp. XS5]